MTEQVNTNTEETQPVKKVRKTRSDKGQKRLKPYNLKKNKETV